MQKDKIAFAIKTFERYDALEDLLISILKYYPWVDLYIADDSEEVNEEFYSKWRKYLKIKLYRIPFDSGISKGRNIMFREAKEDGKDYILLLDDDFIFTDGQTLEKFYKILNESKDNYIVGGVPMKDGVTEQHYEFDIKYENMILTKLENKDDYKLVDGERYKQVDAVNNFALFRSSIIDIVQWDDELKIVEHLNYYFKLWMLNKRDKYKVLYAPDVKIDHMQKSNKVYNVFRKDRSKEFLALSMVRSGYKQINEFDGRVYKLVGRQVEITI